MSQEEIDEKEKIKDDFNKFQKLWDENETCQIGTITCKIEPLSDDLIDYFKEQAPESIEEVPTWEVEPELRPYQEVAVKKWFDNGCKGIFEMATGTGKTWAAIGCIKKLQNIHKKLVVVIAAPYTNLVDQWEENLNLWNINSIKLDKAWTKRIRRAISAINDEKESKLINNDFFNGREKTHLLDVKDLIQKTRMIYYTSVILFILLLFALTILLKFNFKNIAKRFLLIVIF